MEEQIVGSTSVEEVVATTEVEIPAEPPKSEEADIKAELDKTKAELQQAKDQLASVDSDRRGQSRTITRLQQELEAGKSNLLQDAQSKKLHVLAQSQDGTLDMIKGTAVEQMKSIDENVQAEIRKLNETVVHESAADVLTSVKGKLKESGLDPEDLKNPTVAKVYREWQRIEQTGGIGLEDIVERTGDYILASKAVNEEELRKKIKSELMEEFKKNPALRVDTGSPAGGTGDDAFLLSYSKGESDDHPRAQKLLNKK